MRENSCLNKEPWRKVHSGEVERIHNLADVIRKCALNLWDFFLLLISRFPPSKPEIIQSTAEYGKSENSCINIMPRRRRLLSPFSTLFPTKWIFVTRFCLPLFVQQWVLPKEEPFFHLRPSGGSQLFFGKQIQQRTNSEQIFFFHIWFFCYFPSPFDWNAAIQMKY